MGLFEDIKEEQAQNVANKDKKGGDNNREFYFNAPKDSKGNVIEQFKPVAGINKFDILPFYFEGGIIPGKTAGMVGTRLPVQVYKNVGPSKSGVLSLTQLMKDDPIKNEYTNLQGVQRGLASQDDKDKFYENKMKPLRAQYRSIYLVLHHVGDKKILKWFDVSDFMFQKKMDNKIEELQQLGETVGVIADPVNGKTVAIFGKDDTFKTANGSGEFVKIESVSFVNRDKPIAATEEKAKAILAQLPKLDACLNVKTTEEVETLFYGAPLEKKEAEDTSGLNVSNAPTIEVPETGTPEEPDFTADSGTSEGSADNPFEDDIAF